MKNLNYIEKITIRNSLKDTRNNIKRFLKNNNDNTTCYAENTLTVVENLIKKFNEEIGE